MAKSGFVTAGSSLVIPEMGEILIPWNMIAAADQLLIIEAAAAGLQVRDTNTLQLFFNLVQPPIFFGTEPQDLEPYFRISAGAGAQLQILVNGYLKET